MSDHPTIDSSGSSTRYGRLRTIVLSILCHPDIRRIGHWARLFEPGETGDVALHRFEPLFGDAYGGQLSPLGTRRASRVPTILSMRNDGTISVRVPSTLEVFVDGQRVERDVVVSTAQLDRGVLLRLSKYVLLKLGVREVRRGAVAPATAYEATRELIGQSQVMQRLRDEIARLHDLDISVLLRGETGVGKELVASALQRGGPCSDGPFLRVNVGAIPGTMAVAELFGYAKGAFTGANAVRAGYFAEAHGGTLFLDEIGASPAELQSALLRVMETGITQPIGGKQQQVSVRLIAATDADLDAAVEAGKFSAALVRRFDYVIRVPPLRERREDISELFARFVLDGWESLGESQQRLFRDMDLRPLLNVTLVEQLMAYAWPGNVRELQAVARRFVIYNRGRASVQLDPELQALVERVVNAAPRDVAASAPRVVPAPANKQEGEDKKPPRGSVARLLTLEEIERAREACEFDLERTARMLGISRSFLHAKIDKLPSIRKAKDISADEIEAALNQHGHDLARAAHSLRISSRALQLQMTRLGLNRKNPPPT